MRIGLVLEGGAMQGMYTAGVLDVFMEEGVRFDGVIGVSAGALFGVNYVSHQIGRAIRYNKRFNKEKNYMGAWSLLTSGNIVNTEFAYRKVPFELDVFDNETFMASGIPFYAVVTNIRTGRAEYPLISNAYEQMDVLRASGSMPFVSQPVELGGEKYLDGAVADSIPFERMLELGYDRLVVVLTKGHGYIKKPISKPLSDLFYRRRYPNMADSIIDRHNMYNGQMKRLEALAQRGIAKVVRPSKGLYIKKLERDPARMEELYQLGRKDARDWLAAGEPCWTEAEEK